MSYEVEPIQSNPGTPIPSSIPSMREERLVDPYQSYARKMPIGEPAPPIGQVDTARKAAPEESRAEDTVRLSPQMAALARKEQRFRQQQQSFEKERAEIAAERAEIAELKALKQKLAAKDYSGLEGLVDYNDYSQYQVNRLNGSDPVQEEIRKLNGKISEIEKNSQETVNKQYEAAVQERRIAAQELVNKGTEFPRIKKANAHEAVVKHIMDTWEHDSKELSVEQAAKEVEEVLVEKARQWAKLLEDENAAPASEEKKPLPSLKPGLKTLTNQVTTQGELKRPVKSLQHMSDQERWAEARRRAEEKLQMNRQ